MNPDYAALLDMVNRHLELWFVVFLRVGAVTALAPGFGEASLPVRIKLVAAIAFTAIVAPAISETGIVFHMDISVFSEILIGLAVGAMLRFILIIMQIAGSMASQAASLSQLFGGTAGEPQPAIGHLLTMGALAFALMMGLHIRIAELLIESYIAFPPQHALELDLLRQWSVSGASRAFSLGFLIAAPFIVSGLIYNVALGAINRAMPQLMVAFVGAPALTAGGLVVLALAAGSGILVWHGHLEAFLANPFEVPK